jgi:hypothetical protein
MSLTSLFAGFYSRHLGVAGKKKAGGGLGLTEEEDHVVDDSLREDAPPSVAIQHQVPTMNDYKASYVLFNVLSLFINNL